MNVGNTAAVFAPNLLRPRVESIEQLADTSHVVNLIAFMISEPHRIFSAFGNERAPASSRVQSNDCLAANDSHASKLQAGPRLTQVASPGATPATADGSKPWYYLNDNLEQQGPVSALCRPLKCTEVRDTRTHVCTKWLVISDQVGGVATTVQCIKAKRELLCVHGGHD